MRVREGSKHVRQSMSHLESVPPRALFPLLTQVHLVVNGVAEQHQDTNSPNEWLSVTRVSERSLFHRDVSFWKSLVEVDHFVHSSSVTTWSLSGFGSGNLWWDREGRVVSDLLLTHSGQGSLGGVERSGEHLVEAGRERSTRRTRSVSEGVSREVYYAGRAFSTLTVGDPEW